MGKMGSTNLMYIYVYIYIWYNIIMDEASTCLLNVNKRVQGYIQETKLREWLHVPFSLHPASLYTLFRHDMGDRRGEYRWWWNGVIKGGRGVSYKRNSVHPFCTATTSYHWVYTPYRFLWFLPKATDALAKGKVPYSLWFGKSEGDRWLAVAVEEMQTPVDSRRLMTGPGYIALANVLPSRIVPIAARLLY